MNTSIIVLWAVLSADIAALPTPQERGEAIARELATRNAGYKDLYGEVEMSLEDASGSTARRAFVLKLLERRGNNEGDQSLITFSSPADVKGTAVLSRSGAEEDEQWVFLPSSRRTRRISSSNRTGAFVGSEFTFEDLTGNDGRKYSWSHTGNEACGEVRCFVVEAVPRSSGSGYSRRVLHIDEKDFRIHSIQFFDRQNTKLKTLTYTDYRNVSGPYWRAHLWTMTNHQNGKKTIVRFTRMKLANGYTVQDFAPGKLGG